MLLASFVLTLIPVALGGNLCCIPNQWEGTEAQVIGSAKTGATPTITQTYIKVHYDQTNNRMAFDEKVMVNGHTANVKVIQLWGRGVEYVIQQTGTCTRKHLTGAFPQGCIPDTATLEGTHYEGSARNHINYNSYRLNYPSKGLSIIADMTSADMTSGTCEPIRQETFGQTGNEYYMISNRYYDITKGIKDPSVFNVPPSCQHAPFQAGAHPIKGSFFG